MLDKFEEFDCSSETITNYELYLKPKGIYKFKELICDNYLYPVYKTNISNEIYYSTSVYALIVKRKKFIRNPNFQTTDFYRPTFQTIDKQVERVRTISMTSDKSIDDPNEIIVKSAEIFQEYITEIENKFSGYKHLLLMGGKDSQNYLLADRKEKWIVISGEPNGSLNKEFISSYCKNNISNKKIFLSLLLTGFLILFFSYEVIFTGGGIFFQLSNLMFGNNILFFAICFLSILLFISLWNINDNNKFILFCLIVSTPQLTIYHKYFDPLLIVIIFLLLELNYDIKKIVNIYYLKFLYFFNLGFLMLNYLK